MVNSKISFPIIIQARLSSKRLPNKVLLEINGIPLIEYLIKRIEKIFNNSKILIATSDKSSDDPLVSYCINKNINFFRGSLENVAKRMFDAANKMEAESFVRVNGDSPLIDPKIILKGINFFNKGNYDIVTNTFPRTYPIGQSVEIIKTKSLKKSLNIMNEAKDFEHITRFFYNNPNIFKIFNFKNDLNLNEYRLVVDTASDYEKIKIIINKMDNSYINYNMDDIINIFMKIKTPKC